jgi:hypothetical protein
MRPNPDREGFFIGAASCLIWATARRLIASGDDCRADLVRWTDQLSQSFRQMIAALEICFPGCNCCSRIYLFRY